MSKRRINQQQRKRIASRHARHLHHLENQQLLKHQNADEIETNLPIHSGLVLANLGKTILVETESQQQILCHQRQHLDSLVPGDTVIWQQQPDDHSHVIIAHQPRKSLLARYNERGQIKPMAANLDQLLIVFAPNPPPHWALIDKYMVLAQHLHINVRLVMNKIDLNDIDETITDNIRYYQKLNYPLHKTSTKTGEGITELQHMLQGHCSLFVGQSGVGKSALTQIILPKEDITIAPDTLETAYRLGVHTTTTTRLYHLPGGGDLIDSPGVRIVHTVGLTPAEITAGFSEIAHFAALCHFTNCQHQQEPRCAVKDAVVRGDISARRLAVYFATLAENVL